MTLSIEPLAADPPESTWTPTVAVVASATFHRDVLAFVLGEDPAFEVGPAVCSLDELNSRAHRQVDIAVVVLPDDTGVAVLPRSAERSWSEQLTCGDSIVVVGWDTPPLALRQLLERALSRPSRHGRERAAEATLPPRLEGQPDIALRALTDREFEVLVSLAEGRSANDTATAFGISPNTVRTHVANLLRKLGAHSRLEAVAMTRSRLRTEQHRRDMNTSHDVG